MSLRRPFATVVAALGGWAVLLGASAGPGATDGQIDLVWLKDYAAAQQSARQAGKPRFVVFR